MSFTATISGEGSFLQTEFVYIFYYFNKIVWFFLCNKLFGFFCVIVFFV